ncbi:MAG: cupredoxin domain-containing protein [Candidatus Liptonbacteria bacterium]
MFISKKTKIIALAAGLIIVAALAAYFLPSRPQIQNNVNEQRQFSTRIPAPLSVTVPEPGMQNIPANIAVPEREVPVSPSAESQYRVFSMRADNNAFSPNTIIGKRGDIIHIAVSAIDNAYDFTQPDYGFNVQIKKGQTKTIEFNASASGQFTFYCKSCASQGAAALGTIIIAEP